MYADRYGRSYDGMHGINRTSLGIAIAINGAILSALLLTSPTIKTWIKDPPLITYRRPLDPIPEPPPPKPTERTTPSHRETPTVSLPPIQISTDPEGPVTSSDPTPIDLVTLGGTGSGPAPTIDPPQPNPVVVQPGLDPRYAGDLQPPTPLRSAAPSTKARWSSAC